MKSGKLVHYALTLILAVGLGSLSARAEDNIPPTITRAGVFGISGDAGYYTYGMSDLNNTFLKGTGGEIKGGVGYGGALKLGLTDAFMAKVGMDYLTASTSSSITILGTKYSAEVNLPATLLFIGGEYSILPTSSVDLKIIAGYTLVSVYSGAIKGLLEQGTVSGSGSGFQAGAGIEVYLGRSLSLETDLAYNYARIDGVTFAGVTVDPSFIKTLDYSGLVVKAAINIYLIP